MSENDPSNLDQSEPLLIVISGPSGVGKDTVIQHMKKRAVPIRFVVTATTRSPRPGEKNGVDYFFYSKEEFAAMIEQGELLEYAIVYNDFKGIPKESVRQALNSGQDSILRIDVQGAATVHKLYPDAVLIFLTTTQEELARRLKSRPTANPEDIPLRIATARGELKRIEEFDYVVNNRDDQLDETVNIIMAIVKAEHHRVHPRKVTL